jgi:hypothetical protein
MHNSFRGREQILSGLSFPFCDLSRTSNCVHDGTENISFCPTAVNPQDKQNFHYTCTVLTSIRSSVATENDYCTKQATLQLFYQNTTRCTREDGELRILRCCSMPWTKHVSMHTIKYVQSRGGGKKNLIKSQCTPLRGIWEEKELRIICINAHHYLVYRRKKS